MQRKNNRLHFVKVCVIVGINSISSIGDFCCELDGYNVMATFVNS